MAGSYNHVVDTKTGSLLKSERVQNMLECVSGDVFECIEEMYGMIWQLAYDFITADPDYLPLDFEAEMAVAVEQARLNYKHGLALSPTKRYKE